MRVLYIFSQFYLPAGTERILTLKMNYLADVLGYEVHSLATYQREDQPNAYPTSEKIIQHRLAFDYLRIPLLRPWQYFLNRKKMGKKVEEEIARIKPDFIIASTVVIRFLLGIQLPKGSKLILESHISRHGMWLEVPWLIRVRRLYQLDKLIRKTDKIVCLTEADAEEWPKEKTYVIPNFVDVRPELSFSNKENPYATPQERDRRVIALGRFCRQKGFDLLIKAWATVNRKHPDWRLQIGGYHQKTVNDIKEIEHIPKLIKDLGMSDVITLGPRIEDVEEFYASASFFVLSSRHEGFGLVLLEAMTCGLPCISFDCPSGPAEIITDGVDGLLVENGNIKKLAESICYMIEHEEERKRMSLAAIEKAKRFNRDNIMMQWHKLFTSQ